MRYAPNNSSVCQAAAFLVHILSKKAPRGRVTNRKIQEAAEGCFLFIKK